MTDDTRRVARCHCGQLTVTTIGEPIRVAMCHCEDCQRRTGSSYNLGAVFDEPNIALHGDFTTYVRQGEMGLEITFHFCPGCGSNVYWTFGDAHVVAAGCYADPTFPGPDVSLYGKRRHRWLPRLNGIPSFVGNRNTEHESI